MTGIRLVLLVLLACNLHRRDEMFSNNASHMSLIRSYAEAQEVWGYSKAPRGEPTYMRYLTGVLSRPAWHYRMEKGEDAQGETFTFYLYHTAVATWRRGEDGQGEVLVAPRGWRSSMTTQFAYPVSGGATAYLNLRALQKGSFIYRPRTGTRPNTIVLSCLSQVAEQRSRWEPSDEARVWMREHWTPALRATMRELWVSGGLSVKSPTTMQVLSYAASDPWLQSRLAQRLLSGHMPDTWMAVMYDIRRCMWQLAEEMGGRTCVSTSRPWRPGHQCLVITDACPQGRMMRP